MVAVAASTTTASDLGSLVKGTSGEPLTPARRHGLFVVGYLGDHDARARTLCKRVGHASGCGATAAPRSNSPLVWKRVAVKEDVLSLPFISYEILFIPAPPPCIMPMACRTMRKAEIVIGTSMAKLLALRNKDDAALRTVLGCRAPKMRLMNEAMYVDDETQARFDEFTEQRLEELRSQLDLTGNPISDRVKEALRIRLQHQVTV